MLSGKRGEQISGFEGRTLSDIVTWSYRAARVFEKYNLDFCCRGNRILADACREKNIDLTKITEELNDIRDTSITDGDNFDKWSEIFLTDYIINVHHEYVNRMIPILTTHTEKVASVHGKVHPETIEVARKFSVLYKDLRQHMMKEEEILFPYVRYLAKAAESGMKIEKPYFGSAENPISVMSSEHEAAGEILEEIRELTGNYRIPADACNTFSACYNELKEFEEDLHKHIHLENNILFPKIIELEKSFL